MLPNGVTLPTNNCAEYYVQRALCKTCQRNYFLLHNACVPCPETEKDEAAISLFTQCSCGASNFRHCKSEAQKACKRGYFLKGAVCEPCSPVCQTCEAGDKCTTFRLGNEKHSDQNVGAGSLVELVEVLQKVYDCNQNCAHCDGAMCLSCVPGYFINQEGQCQKCEIKNCQICASDALCDLCQPNFYVSKSGRVCQLCKDQNCMRCEFEDGLCSICRFGYTLQADNTCVKSKVDGCVYVANIGQGQQFCAACAQGYMTSFSEDTDSFGAVCTKCVTGCAVCSNLLTCDQCKVGWVLTDGQCVQCNENNCLMCGSEATCLLTQDSLLQALKLEDGMCFNLNLREYPRYVIEYEQLMSHSIMYMSGNCKTCNLYGDLPLGCRVCSDGALNRLGDCVVAVEQEEEPPEVVLSLTAWQVAGITIGVLVGVAVAGVVAWLIYRYKHSKVKAAPKADSKIKELGKVMPSLNISSK